jgi:hypothetical protein
MKFKILFLFIFILAATVSAHAAITTVQPSGGVTVSDTGVMYVTAVNIGTIASPITSNPYALAATNCYNSVLYYGATGTINLPASVAGMNIIIYNTGAFTIEINPNGSEVIVRDGNTQGTGVAFSLSSGLGNFVALTCDVAGHWTTLGYKGTLTQTS